MEQIKIVSTNRKAKHDYFLEKTYEAGLSLLGTEIKSIRAGHCQFVDAYIDFVGSEALIVDMHIAPYDHGNIFNHDETRPRKLLLHKMEIRELRRKVQEKGYTVVPTKMYLKNGLCKLEIALAKGKHTYDKKESLKERDIQREIQKSTRIY